MPRTRPAGPFHRGAIAGSMCEKSWNESQNFHTWEGNALNFYRGRDLKSRNNGEIDLIIEQDGTLRLRDSVLTVPAWYL